MEEEIKKEFAKIWKAIEEIRDIKFNAPETIKEETSDDEEKIQTFCNELKIERKNFGSIIKISKQGVSLKVPIDGKNEAEKQLKTTLVLMAIKDSLFEEDFMKSSDIAVVLKRLGVKSIMNLAKNLNKHANFLRPEGKPRSKNFGFRITIPGNVEGKKIIGELLDNE